MQSTLDRLLAGTPGATGHLRAWYASAFAANDPALLGLCATYVAKVIGADDALDDFAPGLPPTAVDPAKLTALASWWSAPEISERERACLRFVDQWLIDVGSTTDEQVDSLLEHLTPEEVLGFLMGLLAVEQSLRVATAARRLLGPTLVPA